MWTLEKVKKELGDFLGTKMTQKFWLKISKFSRKMTTKILSWHKMFHREGQLPINSCDWGSNWSLQQKTTAEINLCSLHRFHWSPSMWINNSSWLTKWLDLGTMQTEKIVWRCCGTMRTNQWILMLKSKCLQERRRKRTFKKCPIEKKIPWIINLVNVTISVKKRSYCQSVLL